MSYQVLARKWRPEKFQDVIGQEHITRSLKNSILRNRLGHAYILTGTRGIGKTSVARLFAKALRCQSRLEDGNPCGHCQGCEDFASGSSLNVHEIDGASNNSVDNIRNLINTVQTLPTFGTYKIYIIDEVHMLSTSAFNALLKTLEEPPEHAIFILATTEPDKLLDTVLSRCQRFDFRNATVEILEKHIRKICEVEKIEFENENLIKRLCYQGKGSVRDTLSLLDQVLSFSMDNKISEETVSVALGLATREDINFLLDSMLLGDSLAVSSRFLSLLGKNIDPNKICQSLLDTLYFVITNIENKQKIENDLGLDLENYKDVSDVEWIWLFETMTQDFKWGLESIYPNKSIEIILKKISLRREIFSTSKKKVVKESSQIETILPEVGKPEIMAEEERKPIKIPLDIPKEELETPTMMEKSTPEMSSPEDTSADNVSDMEKSWDGFLTFLRKNSRTAVLNLEQGNVIEPLSYNGKEVHFKLGFPHAGKVFFNHLNENDQREKLTANLARFFQVDSANIKFELILLNEEKKKEMDFKTVAEVNEEIEEKQKEQQEQDFLQEPLLVEAQKLFNAKIDKVKLKTRE